MADRPEFERAPLKGNEILRWPKVEPVNIIRVFDANRKVGRAHRNFERGYLGVDERGNIQSFLHQWTEQKLPDGSSRLVSNLTHQGGPGGFDDIERPMRQYVRVIKRYMGVIVAIEDEDDGEEVLQPPLNFREFADSLRQTEKLTRVEGHKDWVRDVGHLIDQAILDVTTPKNPTILNVKRETLEGIKQRLDRSKNPLLDSIGSELGEVIGSSDRFKKLAALQRAGGSVLDRMRAIDQIVLALMIRHSRLEAHRQSSEEKVLRIAKAVNSSHARWAENEDARSHIVQNLPGNIRSDLDDLITNSFRERAKRLQQLKNLALIIENDGPGRVKRILDNAVVELDTWGEGIKAAINGRVKDRYPVQT